MSVIKFALRSFMENKYLKQRVIGIHFFILSVLLIGNSSQLFAINIGSDNFRQNPFDSVEEMTNQLLIIIDLSLIHI